MAPKTRKISTLIETQLPGFISSEYVNFSKFIEKYYEHLEAQGQPLDILFNITKYRDINFYDQNIIKESTILTANITESSSTIVVEDASSFPKENGYIKIGNEICFYKTRTDNTFEDVSRGISGNTTLGDLYNSSEFVTTEATPHYTSDVVFNISNLFLYALVKNFEDEYLGAFPEKYLKGEIDKRTLIKNISNFYKAKGTDRSIQFIFKSLISQDPTEQVTVYNPKDFTLKASTSDWVSNYSLKVKIISGDATKLIGNTITQVLDSYDQSILFASAVVDNVIYRGTFDDEEIYEIVLEPSTVNGNFKVAARTTLRSSIQASNNTNDRIDIYSTLGFPKKGKILINNEQFAFKDKNVNQLIVDFRSNNPSNHSIGSNVYSFSTVEGKHDSGSVTLLPLGVIYNLLPKKGNPYSKSGDIIQVSDAGFETRDPVIFDRQIDQIRWFVNTQFSKVNSIVPGVNSQVGNLIADVSAIYEDDQYYYICSSSFPSNLDLLTNEVTESLSDQKSLKLIRKYPTTTTEVYKTSTRDVGILIDGSPIFSYKDEDFVKYGNIESVKIESKGNNYKTPPFVLINGQPNKAVALMAGETVNSIEITNNEIFEEDPIIRITSGEGAELKAVVTEGRITSLTIENSGQYYSSPPTIRISDELGKGNFAEYEAILNNEGQIIECKRITGGRLYTRGYVNVFVDASGRGAQATAKIKRWVKNRYEKIKTQLDTNNSYVFQNFDSGKNYGYGVVANPVVLRKRINDSINALYEETTILSHSPIIGYAYDGNPIYGPYGYSNPLDSSSAISRLSSGYSLKGSRLNGPSISTYSLGTFIDDYEWIPSVNSGKTELDQNNGRFCVTPDYPNGVYAYFTTVNSSNVPVFPYILGDNFYSLPVDSNYNSKISQDDVPLTAKRLKTVDFENNGQEFVGFIQDVNSGSISSATIYNSVPNFSVGSQLIINQSLTEGSGVEALISSVKGKEVISLESTQSKAVRITTSETAYLFEGDIIAQEDTDAAGFLIGDVVNDNTFVLRSVDGTFNLTSKISSSTKVFNLILDKNSNFTKGSILTLTDGKNNADSNIAVGEVLEGISRQNSVKIKVTSGDFIVDQKYFLKSTNLSDTSRAKIINLISLSENLSIFKLDNNIAIIETDEAHNIVAGDKVIVDLIPNDEETETTYFVRKKLYQTATLQRPTHKSNIIDVGIGSADLLNTGIFYTSDTYENIELIFQDSNKAREGIGLPGDLGNARATIQISNPGGIGYGAVSSIILTYKGRGYNTGDILTVADNDLLLISSETTQRLVVAVNHVGFAQTNTKLYLTNVNNLSVDDYLTIGEEIVKITSVSTEEKTVTVLRGQKNTRPRNHYNNKEVLLNDPAYRFDDNFAIFGEATNKPYVVTYDNESNQLSVSYNYGVTNPVKLLQSSTFFDSSTPAKLVKLKNVQEAQFKLEFSKNSLDNLVTNPVVNIQKYYRYKFDTSHFSMADTFLDFSASSNYNIFTEEKFVSNISPGNVGSFVSIKLGFGPNIVGNLFTERKKVNYSSYFYFIKVSPDVNTENSYLTIIDDPLAGEKEILYSTDTKFVYSLDNIPEYDGTGNITYTTTSKFAIGEIDKIDIINSGNEYTSIPVVEGVLPTTEYQAEIEAVYDTVNKNISKINIINPGKNFSKPKVIVTDGDGSQYEFKCFLLNGGINTIAITKAGKNFTYKPTLKVIETDVSIYLNSDTIGVPKNIKIIKNGNLYTNDKTTLSTYKSHTTFVLKDFNEYDFFAGETISQPETGATAKVSKNGWRFGSNLLKVEQIDGIFENNKLIYGIDTQRNAKLVAQISTEFLPEIKSYFDNLGYYSSDKGNIGSSNQRLTDSFFYQDYSYVIKSKTPINNWRDLIKETTHPAGFALFGEVSIETQAESTMPTEQRIVESYSCLNLADINVSTIYTSYIVSKTILIVTDTNIEHGTGTIAVNQFDFTETRMFEVKLNQNFDGDFDSSTGQVVGTNTFTLFDKKTNLPVFVSNQNQLVLSLDGVIQEPGKAFTTSGTDITFSTPPFGERIQEGQVVAPQSFYGKLLTFKDVGYNQRYFNKLQNISDQFDGITTEFDLYYENNQSVRSEAYENFIVVLDGVFQSYKDDATQPSKNSYYISRTDNTDKIIFSEPPKFFDSKYEEAQSVTSPTFTSVSSCFIYGIGNYDRLTISTDSIDYKSAGPHLLLDEVTKKVTAISDPIYALVFVDGVLQKQSSYVISESTISFTGPLKTSVDPSGIKTYQNVSIIVFYGKDKQKTLTAFDYEPDTFFNTAIITITGDFIADNFYDQYTPIKNKDISHIYQNLGDGRTNYIGAIYSIINVSESELKFIVVSENIIVEENTPLSFQNGDFSVDGYFELIGDYSIQIEYKKNEDQNRYLSKKVTPWLYSTQHGEEVWQIKNKTLANLLPGDRILLDGEAEYRTVTSMPVNVFTKNYLPGQSPGIEIYSNIKASNYNGVTRGEGLSIEAVIENGSVIELKWNKKDWEKYKIDGIKPRSTAYQYYTEPYINFVPTTDSGGGARARVIVDNGLVYDVKLESGGTGYEEAPKVVVSRRYKVVKNSRKVSSTRILQLPITPPSASIANIFATVDLLSESASQNAQNVFISFTIGLGGVADEEVVIIAEPRTSVSIPFKQPRTISTFFFDYRTEVKALSPSNVLLRYVRLIEPVFSEENIASVKSGENNEIVKLYSFFVNESLNPVVLEATNDVGAFLDAPMTLTDTIVYIPNTRQFPYSSRLLIGKEIVTYSSKEDSRFLGVVRGTFGTTAITHEAGDYLRHLPELISIVPVNLTVTSISEVYVASTVTYPAYLEKEYEIRPPEELEVLYTQTKVQCTCNVFTINTVQNISKEILRTFPTIQAEVIHETSSFELFVLIDYSMKAIESSTVTVENTQSLINCEVNIKRDAGLIQRINEITLFIPESYTTITDTYITSTTIGFDYDVIAPPVTIESTDYNLNAIIDLEENAGLIQRINEIILFIPESVESITDTYNTSTSVGFAYDVVTPPVTLQSAVSRIDLGTEYFVSTESITTIGREILIIPEASNILITEIYNTSSSILPSIDNSKTYVFSSIITVSPKESKVGVEINPKLDLSNLILTKDITTTHDSISDNDLDVVITTMRVIGFIDSIINILNTAVVLPENYIDTVEIFELSYTDLNQINFLRQITSTIENLDDAAFKQLTTRITKLISEIADPIVLDDLNATNVVTKQFNSGAVDYYENDIIVSELVQARSGSVEIEGSIYVINTRDYGSIEVINDSTIIPFNYVSYAPINSGNNIGIIENNAFIDTGVFDVSGQEGSITGQIGSFEILYPYLTLADFEERPLSAISKAKDYIQYGIPTITELGGLLLNNINQTDTVINIKYSSNINDFTEEYNPLVNFPSVGKLLIGNEIISYTGKTYVSFTGVTRGFGNTTPQIHSENDYLRTTK